MIGCQHGRMGDVRMHGVLAGFGQLDLDGILEEALGQFRDGGGQGGGEQVGLRACGHLGEDGLHVLEEAHVQHLVALVEDDHGHLAEVEGSAIHMVHHTARRAHDHGRAHLQGPELGLVGHATHEVGDGQLGHEGVQFGAHLLGQFPGGQ